MTAENGWSSHNDDERLYYCHTEEGRNAVLITYVLRRFHHSVSAHAEVRTEPRTRDGT